MDCSNLVRRVDADALSWELNTKMLPTVWQGIVQSTLTQLTIKFPSMRHPQPITIAPPIPNLKSLKVLDIDPLCYADDISLLLSESKKLEDLKLQWNPRMKQAREPSVNINSYFGRCLSSNYSIPLKSISIQNLYTHNDGTCGSIINNATLREITLINSNTGDGDEAANVFIDHKWQMGRLHKHDLPKLKMLRVDKATKPQCEFLNSFTGLERLYFIGPHKDSKNQWIGGSPRNSNAAPLPNSPASSTTSSPSASETLGLMDDYLETIVKNHGSTLRHLLLVSQWRLTADQIALIIRNCPNLEQLGLGVEFVDFRHLRLLVPFLPKLKAIRLLDNPDDRSFGDKIRAKNDGTHEREIGNEVLDGERNVLKYVELAGLVFELGRVKLQEPLARNGKKKYRRDVWKRSPDLVRDIDIWGMDTLEI